MSVTVLGVNKTKAVVTKCLKGYEIISFNALFYLICDYCEPPNKLVGVLK